MMAAWATAIRWYLCLLVPTTLLAESSLVQLPLPPSTKVAWVGENIIHNGVPVSIIRLDSEQPPEQVIDFYRTLWQAQSTTDRPAYVENRTGRWQLIGSLQNARSVVVQVSNRGWGTTGFISEIRPTLDVSLTTPPQDLPVPPNSQLHGHTLSQDAGGRGDVLTYAVQLQVDVVLRFYRDAMPKLGWSLSTESQQSDGGVLMFSRQRVSAEIAVQQTQGDSTMVLISRAEKEYQR